MIQEERVCLDPPSFLMGLVEDVRDIHIGTLRISTRRGALVMRKKGQDVYNDLTLGHG